MASSGANPSTCAPNGVFALPIYVILGAQGDGNLHRLAHLHRQHQGRRPPGGRADDGPGMTAGDRRPRPGGDHHPSGTQRQREGNARFFAPSLSPKCSVSVDVIPVQLGSDSWLFRDMNKPILVDVGVLL
jgi:hypothetical protein